MLQYVREWQPWLAGTGLDFSCCVISFVYIGNLTTVLDVSFHQSDFRARGIYFIKYSFPHQIVSYNTEVLHQNLCLMQRLHKSIPQERPLPQELEALQGSEAMALDQHPNPPTTTPSRECAHPSSERRQMSKLHPQTSPCPDWMLRDQRQWGVWHTALHVSPCCDFAGF